MRIVLFYTSFALVAPLCVLAQTVEQKAKIEIIHPDGGVEARALAESVSSSSGRPSRFVRSEKILSSNAKSERGDGKKASGKKEHHHHHHHHHHHRKRATGGALKTLLPVAKSERGHGEKRNGKKKERLHQHDHATGGALAPLSEFGDIWWALGIDGKDAEKGASAYGRDFKEFMSLYPIALGSAADDELSMDIIRKLQEQSEDRNHRGYRCGKHGGLMQPLGDHGPACFRTLDCKSKVAATRSIPREIIDITPGDDCSVDFALPKKAQNCDIELHLTHAVTKYTNTIRDISAEESDKRLMVLAKFLRSFAWMHPFPDGNGRFRTLLLQREVRRLGLGHGAFMYNNNRDIFFIDDETYAAKIKEGIRMADIGMKTKKNPWLDPANVKKHFHDFPHVDNKNCDMGGIWGSTQLTVSQ